MNFDDDLGPLWEGIASASPRFIADFRFETHPDFQTEQTELVVEPTPIPDRNVLLGMILRQFLYRVAMLNKDIACISGKRSGLDSLCCTMAAKHACCTFETLFAEEHLQLFFDRIELLLLRKKHWLIFSLFEMTHSLGFVQPVFSVEFGFLFILLKSYSSIHRVI